MPIGSNWKLTFDPAGGAPLVILDFGEAIEGELRFPWRQQKQRGVPVAAMNGVNFARGASESGLRLTTLKDHADDAAARLWCLNMQITFDTFSGVTTTLKLEIQGASGHFLMGQASLDDCEPGMRIAGIGRTDTHWDIGGCGWTYVP